MSLFRSSGDGVREEGWHLERLGNLPQRVGDLQGDEGLEKRKHLQRQDDAEVGDVQTGHSA